MSLKIKPSQIQVLADFCKDMAKGITLAVILGQGIVAGSSSQIKVFVTIGWIFLGIMFLLFAVWFSSYERL